jgi:hypothetical protein
MALAAMAGAAGIDSVRTAGKGRWLFAVESTVGEHKLVTTGDPTLVDQSGSASYTSGVVLASSDSTTMEGNYFHRTTVAGSTTTYDLAWDDILGRVKEAGVSGAYGVADGFDFSFGAGVSAMGLEIAEKTTTRRFTGSGDSVDDAVTRNTFPDHAKPGAFFSVGARWEPVRKDALHIGVSVTHTSYGETRWKDTDQSMTTSTIGSNSRIEQTDTVESSLKRSATSVRVGASSRAFGGRVEPYALIGITKESAQWERTTTSLRDNTNFTASTRNVTTSSRKITAELEMKSTAAATIGVFVPRRDAQGNTIGGLDVGVDVINGTTYHVGASIRF